MLMLASVLLGFIAYRGMRLEQNPDVSFPVVTVTTVYTGAGPDEINNLVSKKIEDAVSGISNLREVTSTSLEGASTVVLNFELGTNTDVALNDTRTKVDSVINQLPDGTEKPTIQKFDISAQAVLTLAFASKTRNSQQLRDLIDNKLRDKYAQINGVADASILGGDVREIQIQLKKDKLIAYGLGISDVDRQIQATSLNIPGGRILAGNQEYTVRVLAQWENVDQIKNSVITISDNNNQGARSKQVKLKDIATVADTVQERSTYSRLDGKDSIILSIQKTREGNAVSITHQADQVSAQLMKLYPDLQVTKTFEQGKIIENTLEDLNFTLVFAVILVAAVVYLFLHNFRGTLIVAIAIPVCVFVTIIAMALAGFTINSMTMLALILAVGVLVDDAIVVLENIYRHLKMGEDPREAALNGRGEIGTAALAITMADVVVFLPIAFMGGIVGQFFKPLALGYVFAVLTSLFVSFTVTPMLAARWYRAGEDMEHPTGRFAQGFERFFGKLEHIYRRSLEWALHHRWFVFLMGNSALVGIILFIAGAAAGLSAKSPFAGIQTGIPLFFISVILGAVVFLVNSMRHARVMPKFIAYGALFGLLFPLSGLIGGFYGVWKNEAPFKGEFIPTSDNSTVQIQVKLPSDAGLPMTERAVKRIEDIVKKNENVKYVVSSIGTQTGGGFSGASNTGSNYATVAATLYDRGAFLDHFKKSSEKVRWERDTKVAADILEAVGRVPGAEIKVSANSGLGLGSAIQMSFRGEDPALLAQTTSNIVRKLAAGGVKGVINADVSTTPGKPELRAIPIRERLADINSSASTIGAALRTMYTGDDTARFRVSGNEYKVRVQLAPEDKNNPNLVNEVPITFAGGDPVFLGSVAKLVQQPSVDRIDRRDREQEIRITADLLPGYAAGTVQAEITNWLTAEKLVPDGVIMKPLGQADAQAREMGGILSAFAIGIVLVYMLLASLYDNLLYPFIIQLSQPQAMTGAILALVLTDKSLNLVGFIGLVTLVGLVGKNAILVVDYTNTLRDRGRNRHDALVEAGPTRLRPIAMTTLALILGTLPIALAIGRGSEFRETIGIVIIGGIVLSTLLTLLVIPCSYTIFDDISVGLGKVFGRKRKVIVSSAPAASSESETPADKSSVE